MPPLFPEPGPHESDERARLERLALAHAQRPGRPPGAEPSREPPEQLVAGYLLHLCIGDGPAAPETHRQVYEAIAARYPWLAAECRRRVAGRAAQEAGTRFRERVEVHERESRRQAERETVERSKEAIGRLRVGRRVGFRHRGCWHTGVIVGLGRTRATVAYRIFTGRNRDRVRPVHASRLVPFDERLLGGEDR